MNSRLHLYGLGGKPRILTLILVTAALGFCLGQAGVQSWSTFLIFLLGTTLTCNGAGVLNQVLERETDLKMARTRSRPITSGEVSLAEGMACGILLSLGGTVLLALMVNLLSAFLALLTCFLYVLVYTPLKRVTWLNTLVGAIPGALPPMGGWAAATDTLSPGAWILFLIVFLWQHPHFYAIAWMYREDYARAGLKMLPVVQPSGESTFRQIILFTVLLIGISLMPLFMGVSGYWYVTGAVLAGLYYLRPGLVLARTHTVADARKVLRASLIYLPVVLGLMAFDVNF